MKSVGEVMAIGRTFKESLQKAIRSLELELNGLVSRFGIDRGIPAEFDRQAAKEKLERMLRSPIPERLWYLADAMRLGLTDEELFVTTMVDPWFLAQVRELIDFERVLVDHAADPGSVLNGALLWDAKELGFSDDRIAHLLGCEVSGVTSARMQHPTRGLPISEWIPARRNSRHKLHTYIQRMGESVKLDPLTGKKW